MRRLLTLCLLLISLAAAHGAAPSPQSLPDESWPGGRQYDARLERTVKFWGTGVPAADLFASITKQTGVTLAFSPPDDDNARICLNVYLSPKEPPTLRDLMAQISWAMDCAWAVEGEGEARRYVLLPTDVGVEAVARLKEAQRAMYDEQRREAERVAEELRPRVLARLADLREALKLTRQEAIRRYRGKDDLLLFPLLREPDRAAAQVLTELANPPPEELLQGRPHAWQWSELTAEQRAQLRLALQAYQEAVAAAGVPASIVKPAEVPDSAPLVVNAGISHDALSLTVRPLSPDPSQAAGGRPYWPYLMVRIRLVEGPSEDSLDRLRLALSICRLLGEDTAEAERALERADLAEGGNVGRQRRATARKIEEQRPALRPSTWQALADLPSRFDLHRGYTLWQVQEVAAVASGLNIVSDCFWQPPRGLGYQTDEPPSSLLDALRLSTFAWVPRGALLDASPESATSEPGWEWGDAGTFLRFRSRDRDLMRGAFLPMSVEQILTERLEPYTVGLLEKLEFTREEARRARFPHLPIPPRLTVPLDIRESARLALDLTPLQTRWGGVLTYLDPSTPQEAYRQAFRQALLSGLDGRAGLAYRIIGGLDDDAWNSLNRPGLRWGEDFTFRDREDKQAFQGVPLGDDRKGDLYRIEDVGSEPDLAKQARRGGEELPPRRLFKARIGSGGRAWEVPLLLAVWVEAEPAEHLVPPPQEYARGDVSP
jgi:hypothetical protein